MLQRKCLGLSECGIKFEGSRSGTFRGYASMFGGLDSYGDTVAPGAYQKTLSTRRHPVVMLFGHDRRRAIGKWLTLEEDAKGLLVQGELTPGNTDADNVRALMRHGAVSGLSIGYYVPEGGEQVDGDRRTLKEIDLVEISVVTVPADDDARVDLATVKAALDQVNTIAEAESFLRDAGGFSRNAAKAFLSQLKAVHLRDADADSDATIKAMREQIIDLRAAKLLAA